MNKKELKEILKKHRLWLDGNDGERAYLRGAYLRGAYLSGAYLCNADLRKAYLSGADLSGADLSGAYLSGADLSNADLSGAYLSGAYLPNYQICSEVGSFQAFKKTTKGIIRIEIPEDAKRTSSLVGRKCRAEYVKVIDGDGIGGKSPNHGNLTYEKDSIVRADKFDDDIRVECTHGIHFFMTEKEALDW